jgi:hypothetical protein
MLGLRVKADRNQYPGRRRHEFHIRAALAEHIGQPVRWFDQGVFARKVKTDGAVLGLHAG